MNSLQHVTKRVLLSLCFMPWLAGIVIFCLMNHSPQRSALHKALEDRRFEDAKVLVEAGRINNFNPKTDWQKTPLMHAIDNVRVGQMASEVGDWTEIVSLLLSSGADVNEIGWLCYSPLHEAAKGHDPRVIEILLDHGAKINRKNCHGQTPLMIAADISEKTVVQKLLLVGADPNIRANDGKTALEYAKTAEIAAIIQEARKK